MHPLLKSGAVRHNGTEMLRKNIGAGGLLIGGVVVFSGVLIVVNAADPAAALAAFFTGPWNGAWFVGNTLDTIGLLLTAALGVAIAFRGGCFNLGCEGQIYLGGLAASVVLLRMPDSAHGAALALACMAALGTGGALGFVCGALKKKTGANESITSFLLSAALTPLADYLIAGPLRDPAGNLLATPVFAQGRQLVRLLPPSNLSVSFLCALFLVIAGHLFINKTGWGYRFKIAGAAPSFARYAGIDSERYWTPAMTVAGALAGLAGAFAVAGTYGRCHTGFSGGLGWDAIAVALIARNRPLLLFPAALIYGALNAGSRAAMLADGFHFETAAFIQAAVLLFATVRTFRGNRSE
jgi:simple sugar transport system permease protein